VGSGGKSGGGAAEKAGGGSSDGSVQLDESYWLELWAFGTSSDGLGALRARFLATHSPANFSVSSGCGCRLPRHRSSHDCGGEDQTTISTPLGFKTQWIKAHARVSEKKRLAALKGIKNG